MKFAFLSGVLTLVLTASAEAADRRSAEATRTIVGVLMDANCSAIAGTGRHAEPVVQIASAKRKAAKEGTRARSISGKATSDEDRYEGCKATSNSIEFAIHTDGRLFLLDTAGNDMVRQQMRNESFRSSLSTESGEPRWLTLMVEGRASGETLEVVSLRR